MTWTVNIIAAESATPIKPSLLLLSAFDTGESTSDLITNLPSPSFGMSVDARVATNDLLSVYDGGNLVVAHSVTSGEASSGNFALGLSPLSEGAHSLRLKHTRQGRESPLSDVLSLTINYSGIGKPTVTSTTPSADPTPDITIGFVSPNPLAGDVVVLYCDGVEVDRHVLTSGQLTQYIFTSPPVNVGDHTYQVYAYRPGAVIMSEFSDVHDHSVTEAFSYVVQFSGPVHAFGYSGVEYTEAAVPLGADNADRIVEVIVAHSDGASRIPDKVEVCCPASGNNWQTLTRDATVSLDGGLSVFRGPVTGGNTGDVHVHHPIAVGWSACRVQTITGYAGSAPKDQANLSSGGNQPFAFSSTITVGAGDVCLISATHGYSSVSVYGPTIWANAVSDGYNYYTEIDTTLEKAHITDVGTTTPDYRGGGAGNGYGYAGALAVATVWGP